MMILRQLMTWLDRTSVRERVLLAAFLWVGVLLGFRAVLGEVGMVWRQLQADRETLAVFRPLAAQEPALAAELAQVRSLFDQERTLSRSALAGRVDSLAQQAGLQPRRLDTTTEPVGLFDEHRAGLRFENVTMEDLLAFVDLVAAESPYLYLASVRLTADERRAPLVNVPMLEINSFELGSLVDVP